MAQKVIKSYPEMDMDHWPSYDGDAAQKQVDYLISQIGWDLFLDLAVLETRQQPEVPLRGPNLNEKRISVEEV